MLHDRCSDLQLSLKGHNMRLYSINIRCSVFGLCAILLSCAEETSSVVGVWKPAGATYLKGEEDFLIGEDGTFARSGADPKEKKATWKIEGDRFVVTMPPAKESEVVAVDVDPSTVARGRKLLSEESGDLLSVPNDAAYDPTAPKMKTLVFEGAPKVLDCKYSIHDDAEKQSLKIACGSGEDIELERSR